MTEKIFSEVILICDNRFYAKQKLHKAVKVKWSNIVIIDMAASNDKTEHWHHQFNQSSKILYDSNHLIPSVDSRYRFSLGSWYRRLPTSKIFRPWSGYSYLLWLFWPGFFQKNCQVPDWKIEANFQTMDRTRCGSDFHGYWKPHKIMDLEWF